MDIDSMSNFKSRLELAQLFRTSLNEWNRCIKEKPCLKNRNCPRFHKCRTNDDDYDIGKSCVRVKS